MLQQVVGGDSIDGYGETPLHRLQPFLLMAPLLEQPTSNIFLADEHIVITQADEELARIPVHAIKLVGEYTTAAGPVGDDWFIVFMTSEKDWKQLSEYTPGMLEALRELGVHLKAEIIGSLAYSTSWKTSIIWPPQVAGQEMWDVLTQQPTSVFGKLKKALGSSNQQLVLTEAAASVFR